MVKLLKSVWLILSVCFAFLSIASGFNTSVSPNKQHSISSTNINKSLVLTAEESLDEESKLQLNNSPFDGAIPQNIHFHRYFLKSKASIESLRTLWSEAEYPLYIQHRKLLI